MSSKRSKSAGNLIDRLTQQSEPLRRGWCRGAIKDGQVALGLSYLYGEPRRLSKRLYFQEIQQQPLTVENNDEKQQHYQDRTSISNFSGIENSAMAEEDDLQKNDDDDELALTEKAFEYLTRKINLPPRMQQER